MPTFPIPLAGTGSAKIELNEAEIRQLLFRLNTTGVTLTITPEDRSIKAKLQAALIRVGTLPGRGQVIPPLP